MAKIIAVTNQKGGVGKTTTGINLAASLVTLAKRVLLVDLDPQGNATMGSGIDKNELMLSVYDVLAQNSSAQDVIQSADPAGYDILPANGDLTAAEVELLNMEQKEKRLYQALQPVTEQYDYILIDCPPSLSMLTVNALSSADGVIIPMQCEYYALEGLSALINTIEQIQEYLNPALKIEGILRTMYDPRSSLTNDVSTQLTQHFANQVFESIIPRNVRLAEAPSYGLPAILYDRQSKGAGAYLSLAEEFLKRQ